jgi:hypothetical protein
MGHLKDLHIDEEERGYRHVGDRSVCVDCVGDPDLLTALSPSSDRSNCAYCGREDLDASMTFSADALLDVIASGIAFEYTHPIDELFWDEGAYVGEVIDTDDVLHEIGCEIANSNLRIDIINAFLDGQWCRRDYLRLRVDEALLAGWDKFAAQVMHERRYLFLSPVRREGLDMDSEIPDAPETLEGIGRAVLEVGLATRFPAGERWVRARSHYPANAPLDAAALGPATKEKAAANRMSPAGIPMFYGAREKSTAIAEVSSVPQNSRYPLVTVGTFVSARPAILIDLTGLPSIPSLFDEDRRRLRAPIRFLTEFVKRLAAPTARDGLDHLDYVPTQVVTEWFRHVFTTEVGERVNGIVYPSARASGGTCCVLFIDRDACTDVRPGWQDDASKALGLDSRETVVVHPGYVAFRASPSFDELRKEGLAALRLSAPLRHEEWTQFIWKPRSAEYEVFCEKCRSVAATYDLQEYVVRRSVLQGDYSPELEPFAIELGYPILSVVAPAGADLVFLDWLLYHSSHLGIRLIQPEPHGRESVTFALPLPAPPSTPLVETLRPTQAEAFSVRVEIPNHYPPALASQVGWEAQEKIRELLVRLGYPADSQRWPISE